MGRRGYSLLGPVDRQIPPPSHVSEEPAPSTSRAGEAQPEPDAARVPWVPVILFSLGSSISTDILENWIVEPIAAGLSILIAGLVFLPFDTTRKEYTGLVLPIAAIATLATYLLGFIFD